MNILSSKTLSKNGYEFLQPLPELERKKFYEKIQRLNQKESYSEINEIGIDIMEQLGLSINQLSDLHKEIYNTEPDKNSFYFISRVVNQGKESEAYRMHFDSHRFTIVVPLKIPQKHEHSGDLVYFPNIKKESKSSIVNIIFKIFFKIFASKIGSKILLTFFDYKLNSFKDYRPLIFLGRTTLHGNMPVSKDADSERATVLLHFFDPDGTTGLGAIIRKLRNR